MKPLRLFEFLFAFEEPRVEPGFLLVSDEPKERPGEEPAAETKEAAPSPLGPPSGDLHRDLTLLRATFGRGNDLLCQRVFKVDGREMGCLFVRGAADDQLLREIVFPVIREYGGKGLEALADAFACGEASLGMDLAQASTGLVRGETLLLFQGERRFLLIDTGRKVHRRVERAINERIIRGPQEGFTEDLEENLALIQRRLRTPRLIATRVAVGEISRTRCAILHLNGVANPRLVEEVKRRVKGLRLDFLSDSGALETLIEENSLHPYPQVLSTERPDRVAAGLAEGKVAILVDGSPQVLVVPATVLGLLHAAEDYNVRWPYGIFMRLVRVMAVFVLLFLSPLYIAANLYQPEILPTEMLFALVSFKRAVPVPTIVEIILLEFFFELLREAGLRGPQGLVPALTIVIGLFLGIASVFAHALNPILLVVVALSALAALAIPDFSTALSFRLTRYLYMLLTALFGYIGIALGVYLHLHLLVKQKSFGVPMMVPIAPFTKRSKDVVLMGPPWKRDKRSDFLDPARPSRAPKITQAWLEEQRERPLPREDGGGGEA